MNRVVRQHVPARKLPEELRQGIPDDALVTVTVEEEGRRAVSVREIKRQLDEWRRANPRPRIGAEEAAARISDLRDEWDR